MVLSLLVRVDSWLHRVMRGRCWNTRVCLWLEYRAAMLDEAVARHPAGKKRPV